MRMFWAQLRRDLLLAARGPAEAANPLVFFALCTLLFGVGTQLGGEREVGHGAVWVLALFANVLAADGLFARDHEDGTLELMLVHARPLLPLLLGKLLAHWLICGLPVVLLSPLAALVLLGSLGGTPALLVSLLLGTPILALLGAVGAALTVGVSRGGVLLAVLVAPLQLPVLIFGVSAASSTDASGDFAVWMLAAMLAGSLTVVPFAIAKALAISQEY